MHDYAAWCIALLDRLGIGTCDLIGHSNGGRIGIVMAADVPGADRADGARGERGHPPAPDVARRRAGALVQGAPHRRAVRSGPVCAASAAPAAARISAAPPTIERSPESMRGTLVRIVNEDLRALLPKLHLPVLLIWGDKDTETPIDGRTV